MKDTNMKNYNDKFLSADKVIKKSEIDQLYQPLKGVAPRSDAHRAHKGKFVDRERFHNDLDRMKEKK